MRRYGVEERRGVLSPVKGNRSMSELHDKKYVDQKEYHGMIDALMYASTATRPDIACAVHQAARQAENSTTQDT